MGPVKLYVQLKREDDPAKCTAAKLVRFGMAVPIRRASAIPRGVLVLNPFAPRLISPVDRVTIERRGLMAVDCSWERVAEAFSRAATSRWARRLPYLLPSNPVMYAQPGRLSSLEALAAALYIVGLREQARRLLGLYKWSPHFLTLNGEPLEDYASAQSLEDVEAVEKTYAGTYESLPEERQG